MYIQKIHIFIVVLMAKTFESIVKIVVFNIADVKPLQIIAKTMFFCVFRSKTIPGKCDNC